jgi:hypothetical protein
MVNYPSRSKTRETNKFRLNSKSLFNPSLKEKNVIVINDDTTKSAWEEKGQSPMTSSYKGKRVKLESKDEYDTTEE